MVCVRPPLLPRAWSSGSDTFVRSPVPGMPVHCAPLSCVLPAMIEPPIVHGPAPAMPPAVTASLPEIVGVGDRGWARAQDGACAGIAGPAALDPRDVVRDRGRRHR